MLPAVYERLLLTLASRAVEKHNNDLPLELLVEITDHLSIETCLNLAEVTPRLAAAVARSLRNTNCHVQGYWRERASTDCHVAVQVGVGYNLFLARYVGYNISLPRIDWKQLVFGEDELTKIFAIFHSLGHLSISIDIGNFIQDHSRTKGRLKTFSLSFLNRVSHIEKLEWDCEAEVNLDEIPKGCSKICYTNDENQDLAKITERMLEEKYSSRRTIYPQL